MEKEKELTEQLESIASQIEEARRELKTLRRHPAEGARGKGRAAFLAGRERMAEADEAARRLETLERQEAEIRARLQSTDHPASSETDASSL